MGSEGSEGKLLGYESQPRGTGVDKGTNRISPHSIVLHPQTGPLPKKPAMQDLVNFVVFLVSLGLCHWKDGRF